MDRSRSDGSGPTCRYRLKMTLRPLRNCHGSGSAGSADPRTASCSCSPRLSASFIVRVMYSAPRSVSLSRTSRTASPRGSESARRSVIVDLLEGIGRGQLEATLDDVRHGVAEEAEPRADRGQLQVGRARQQLNELHAVIRAGRERRLTGEPLAERAPVIPQHVGAFARPTPAWARTLARDASAREPKRAHPRRTRDGDTRAWRHAVRRAC